MGVTHPKVETQALFTRQFSHTFADSVYLPGPDKVGEHASAARRKLSPVAGRKGRERGNKGKKGKKGRKERKERK